MDTVLGNNEDNLSPADSLFRKASDAYLAEVTEAISAEGFPWQTKRDAKELSQEIARMSEKKAEQLFDKEEDRKRWIATIRKSVEHNLQSQVRAALGTPPEERKRRHIQRIEEERRKIGLKNHLTGQSDRNKLKSESYEDYKEAYLKRRQEYLQNRDYLRTKPPSNYAPSNKTTNGSAANVDPFSTDFNKYFSPYTRAALDNAGAKITVPAKPIVTFKRSPPTTWTDSQGEQHEIAGPFWPKDHLPLYALQTHVSTVPESIEPLNSTDANNRIFEDKCEIELYPRPWRGTLVVYDRSVVQPCSPAPAGCPPHLKFESRFECGNLQQAKRIGRFEYDLVLSNDLYTKRHTQWYYFRVDNMIPGVTYKFNIINLLKKDSLYNYGMKPLFYSSKVAEETKVGWKRTGHHISYSRNLCSKNPLLSRELIYHSLSFQVEFPHADDTCYMAHCYPYSYSDLELYIRSLVDNPATSQYIRQEILCKTRAGNNCHVLTITSAQVPDSDKLGVVISARVHPGETNASWMMKGLLDYLTSNDTVAESLRCKFVFKIVPMLNPDGVVVGNYRTNLAGRDLNRTYKDPKKDSFPTVWHTKNMLESFKENHEVIIYCDLHGHSRKPNVFMYGCTADPKVVSTSSFLEERLFPWMMSQRAPDKFSFQGCKFMVRKCKESTARVVMYRQLGIMNSFTMEATFCGTNFGDVENGRHFNTHDFEDMGRHFCEVLLEYSEAKSANRNEMTQAFVELACKMTRDILRQTLGNFKKISDSEPNSKANTPRPTDEKSPRKSEDDSNIKLRSFANGTREALTITPRARGVNYVDLDVRRARGAENDGKGPEYEVSVKSVHVDSFNDCIKILEGLDLNDCYDESDSSDSDSDSDSHPEDEEHHRKTKENGEGRRKKKKKKKKQNWWDTLSKSVQEQDNKDKADEEINKNRDEKKIKTSFGKFVNPYTNRCNNGIPTYSQERIKERAKKREMEKEAEEKEKQELQAKFATEDSLADGPMIAFTDDTELNFVTAQRRLTYYMMNQKAHPKKQGSNTHHTNKRNMTVLPSNGEDLQVDSVKVDCLPGGGYGFAFRFPSRAQASPISDPFTSPVVSLRQPSLQSFEEARSLGSRTPAFVEVPAEDMISRAQPEALSSYRDRSRNHGHRRTNKSDGRMDLETMFRLVNNPRTRNRTLTELRSSDSKPDQHFSRAKTEQLFTNYRESPEEESYSDKRVPGLRRARDGSTPSIRSPGRTIERDHEGSPEMLTPDVIPSYSFVSSRRHELSPGSMRRLLNR